jgi:pimeloyl-ACP methyl ester carboxylesterase
MTDERRSPALRTFRSGSGQGDTVVVIHGTMDNADSFRRVARNLDGWTVIGYDRRGWGNSRGLGGPEVTFAMHVEDLCMKLRAMSSPIIAGHSYGALVALCGASRHPELVSGVLAFEPPIRWLPWWPTEDPWEQSVRKAAGLGPEHAARSLLQAVIGGSEPVRIAEKERADLSANGQSLINEMTDPSLDTPHFEPLCMQIPTVVAAGSSSVTHHREVSRHLADLLPRSRFIEVRGARHNAHITHSREFAVLIRETAAFASAN